MSTLIADIVKLAAKGGWSELSARLSEDLNLASRQTELAAVLVEVAHLNPPEEFIKAFLSAGGDLGHRNREGYAAVHAVADNCGDEGAIETMELLLQFGASLSARGPGGWTPLHFAARRGCAALVGRLTERGADPNAAADSPDKETPLMLAARGGWTDICKALIASGARADTVDLTGWSAAEHARRHGHDQLARYLADSGSTSTTTRP
jgi:ankyrin repeat protein